MLTSTRNDRVRAVAALSRRRERRDQGRHLVEGPGPVTEALAAGVVEEVFLDPEAGLDLVWPTDTTVTEVAPHVLERLADTASPQGVVAVARPPQVPVEDAVVGGRTVLLHAVSDPGNAGTILRSADAAGASGVVLTTGSVDPYGPRALRAAAGSTYHLPVAVEVPLDDAVAACRDAGQRVLGLDARADASVDDLATETRPTALVLGNEAHGLDPAAVGLLDGTVAIPIHGRAESLNVAAAAAVALYTLARSWHAAP